MGHILGSSMVGLTVTSSNRDYATPRTAASRAPATVAGHCWPVPLQETFKHSKAVLAQSLLGLLVCTRFCLSPLNIPGGYGVWFLMRFHPSYLLSGAFPLPLDVGYLFLVGANILLSMVVQQRVIILEFSQKMSTRPSSPPSWNLSGSVKLWGMPCRATQDRQVMVESSNKTFSTR